MSASCIRRAQNGGGKRQGAYSWLQLGTYLANLLLLPGACAEFAHQPAQAAGRQAVPPAALTSCCCAQLPSAKRVFCLRLSCPAHPQLKLTQGTRVVGCEVDGGGAGGQQQRGQRVQRAGHAAVGNQAQKAELLCGRGRVQGNGCTPMKGSCLGGVGPTLCCTIWDNPHACHAGPLSLGRHGGTATTAPQPGCPGDIITSCCKLLVTQAQGPRLPGLR